MLLKLDNFVLREVDRSARNKVGKALTKTEKKRLVKNCWDKCLRAYANRMKASALLSDFENDKDLVGEAWILMCNILDKFDKSKCGPIAKYDIPGKTKPKTLEFYFLNYFYGRVNLTAKEARDFKKDRGIGYSKALCDEVFYDPDNILNKIKFDYEYDLTDKLMHSLGQKSKEFQEFFYKAYILEEKASKLRSEYKSKYSSLRKKANSFIDELREYKKK